MNQLLSAPANVRFESVADPQPILAQVCTSVCFVPIAAVNAAIGHALFARPYWTYLLCISRSIIARGITLNSGEHNLA